MMKLPASMAVLVILLSSCHPQSENRGENISVELEQKSDGLTYRRGENTPYTGQAVTFTQKNSRQAVETWVNGKAHGTWSRYWSSGVLKREQIWEHGDLLHQRQWYEDGVLKEKFSARNGIAFGPVRTWWPSGRVRRMAFVENDLRPHGHLLEYNEDGTVLVDAIFHHGEYVSGLTREDSLAPPATAQAH